MGMTTAAATTATVPPPPPVISPQLAEKYPQALQAQLTRLSMALRGRFEQEARLRVDVENRWLMDLRQYKGRYEPDEWQRLEQDASRSKVFYKITRKKVRAFDARMVDMLFPGGRARNWSIAATPEPSPGLTPLAEELLQAEQQSQLQELAETVAAEQQVPVEQVLATLQQGELPIEVGPEAVYRIRKEAATAACERMQTVIADQLAEVNYKRLCRQVIHSGNLYGVGLLKSPLAQLKQRPVWQFASDQQRWQMVPQETLVPFLEFVPIWSFYPDSSARCLTDCTYMFQRHVMSREQVAALADRPGFDRALIGSYLAAFPQGDTSPRPWETLLDVQTVSRGENKTERTWQRYEVLEYWGVLDDELAQQAGLATAGEPDSMRAIWQCVWVLGDLVIKQGASPIEGMNHLYHAYHFEEDDTTFWSEGIASIIRDDQTCLNAANRAMMDNAAMTVGAMFEINTDLVSPRENVRDVRPNKVLLRTGDSRQPAIRDIQVQSRINEFLAIRSMFEQQINDATVPAYMQGGSVGGAGRTASGLSMMMGSASMDIKDQILLFDNGITRPLIKSLYHWNMSLNDDPYIKGDYEVVATGTSSLMAKEVLGTQLDQLLPVLSNPMYAAFIDTRKLIEMMLQIRDLQDTGILLSDERYNQIQALQQQIQQLQQQLQQGQALLQNVWQVAPSLVQQAMDRTPPEALAN